MKVYVSPRQVFTDPIMFFAFGFGTGLGPKMPGTWGTLPGIPLAIALGLLGHWWMAAAIIPLFLIGIYLCDQASEKLGVHDHGGIVWDEIVGYLLTALPIVYFDISLWWHIAAFVLFRFFDMVKPWPINWVDRRVGRGFGIMIDDIIAGLFGGIILTLIIFITL